MSENDEGDIPDQLRRLRKVTAPTSFESRLRRRIRLLPPKNGYWRWFLRPVPVALVAVVGALLIAAFFVLPYYFSTPPALPEDGTTPVPSKRQSDQLPGQNPPERKRIAVPLPADSLSTDSNSTRKNDVNTSKLP